MHTITENTDVLVIGGGTAGTVAAIQAARAGVRTTLIEAEGQLGGTMTTGGVSCPGYFFAWERQIIAGIGWELVKTTKDLDGDPMPDFAHPPMVNDGFTPETGRPSHYVPFNRHLYAVIAEEAALQAGVLLHYHEIAVEAKARETGWIVTCIGKGIKREIRTRELIDCTGDAEVVGMLGFAREKSENRQPGTLQFWLTGYETSQLDLPAIEARYQQALQGGMLQPGDYAGVNDKQFSTFLHAHGRNAQHIFHADSTTSATQTAANIAGRASLLRLLRFTRTLPGCEQTSISWMCADTAIRESYRILGETCITLDDYRSGRVFTDAVCWTLFFIDMHTESGGHKEFLPRGVVPTVPLSALVPRGSQRLLVAGRCLSSDRMANSALRVQPSCMAMGQAAGAAA